MMDSFVIIASWALILTGSIFTLIGALGLLRFPDFWTRMHAVSVSDSAGAFLLLGGMALHAGFSLITFKLIIIGFFLFITGPSATHAIANAAFVLRKDSESQDAPQKNKGGKKS